jgi:hypothetical protein
MLDTNVSKSNKIPLPALEVLTNFLEKETGHIHRIRGKYIKKYELSLVKHKRQKNHTA